MPEKIKNWDSVITDKKAWKYQSLHPEFPKISRILFAAPSGAGKTNSLMTLLLGQDGSTPYLYYDEIVIYTRTPQQEKYVALKKICDKLAEKAHVKPFCTITNDPIKPVKDVDKELVKVVIFDDLIGCAKEESKKIENYFTFGRHHRCHCIYLSQSYFQTPIMIRKNCSHFCIYHLSGKREINAILYDHGEVTQEQYDQNASGYDFICINKFNKTVTKNFDIPLD